MRYYAFACDFDGTLAFQGKVNGKTLSALERLRNSGRKLILVTGRILDDLIYIFPHINIFDRVIAENGAVIYRPFLREEKLLCERLPEKLAFELCKKGVDSLSVGQSIISTIQPYETKVLETVRDLGIEAQLIFNKGAVMVLPSGVNKSTGLRAALDELGLSHHNTVGIGDAENDHSFLSICEFSVAVANALPSLKERVDYVAGVDHGDGVIEIIDKLLDNDLSGFPSKSDQHLILLGKSKEGKEVRVRPYNTSILLSGTSGSGKSTFAAGFLERLSEYGYQFCIIDPEGDYLTLDDAVVIGGSKQVPVVDEVVKLLDKPEQNCVVNMLGVTLADRPAFFDILLSSLLELRSRTGRPHWIVIDETHHLISSHLTPSDILSIPKDLSGMLFITVHPDHLPRVILSEINIIFVIGESSKQAINAFSEILGQAPPSIPPVKLEPGEAIAWWRKPPLDPFWFRSIPPRSERRRHLLKYAEGKLGIDKSFYFRGPEMKLKLRAHNLVLFTQMADGIDDDTWMYHLHRGDYSRWLKESIKDDCLAKEIEDIEQMNGITPEKSRSLIKEKIEKRYTGPT
ncbi:MAG: DUF87 domain-containing protein [wastewater metagenome]|nr:DUF87 domain-containing protein [Candidatus Loosdrechtia aerotolerans]